MVDAISFGMRFNCRPEDVTPQRLGKVTDLFSDLMKAARAQEWRVKGLSIHSVDIVAEPVILDEDAIQAQAFLKSTFTLTPESVRAASHEQIRVVERMKKLSQETQGDGFTVEAAGESIEVDSSFFEKWDELLRDVTRRSFGHVRGVVTKLILQKGKRFIGLSDSLTGRHADVRFPAELDGQVRLLTLGSRIDVRGVKQARGGSITLSAEGIDVVPEPGHELAGADELEGIVSLEYTGGLSSTEFVSRQRDEFDRNLIG